jgi:hypothetical protein
MVVYLMPKDKIVNVKPAKSPKQKISETAAWKESTPHGGTTEQWRQWGKTNPNRVSNAARTMRVKKTDRTEVQGETTEQWQSRRPKGGGRGVAAPHPEWVAWGKSKPGSASQAAKTVRGQGKKRAKKK